MFLKINRIPFFFDTFLFSFLSFDGMASFADWEAMKRYSVLLIDWPFGRLWWSVSRDYYPPGLVSEIDEALASNREPNRFMKQMKEIMEGIKDLEGYEDTDT